MTTPARRVSATDKGLNMKDPKVRANLYMQTHGIKELFDGLGTLLLFHRPDEPRAFLAQHLADLQRSKQNQSHVAFFEEQDLDAMFASFDVNDQGFITPAQYDQALKSLGIDRPTLRLPESISQITHSLFTRSMTQEIKNASASFM
ncbi:hypothetical protein PINS_up021757 [Pythium insidiosum]|nr:hypothetical protein PINS_up021757 [Pythium insidiosum]